MPEARLLEQIPLWAVFVLSIAIVVASIAGGLALARARRKGGEAVQEGPVGSAVGATLGLLAFMLAFTFSIATGRRDARRELLLDEVNAIGTTYLRASLIPEQYQSEVRQLLKRYVDLRVEAAVDPAKLREAVAESRRIQNRLWEFATAISNSELRNPDIVSLFIDSLNETIDLQTKRVTVAFYRIPGIIWTILGMLTVLSMAVVGYHFGLAGRANWLVIGGLALSFAMVIVLIADLDRAASGWLKVSQEPMIQLQADLSGG